MIYIGSLTVHFRIFKTFLTMLQAALKKSDDLKLIANSLNKGIIDNDLKNLELWKKKWLLGFNLDKCKVMHVN